MSDNGPMSESIPRPPARRVDALVERLRRRPAPDEDFDADDARTAGLVALDRFRRPR